jgi:4-hydroxy-2-oxoheptanedioate aldolase
MSRVRDVWAEGRTAFGVWIVSASPSAAELIASLGFDYIGIDCQHGLIAYEGMRDILLATSRLPVSPIVRVPANDDSWIGKALDAGAEGIIVPLVNSAADAERAARACRFPPDGVRSYGMPRAGPLGRTTEEINSNVLCFPMIETRAGLDAADEICATPGVDGVYIGPSDLALALGLSPGRGRGTPPAPEHAEAVDRIRVACERAWIVPGIHSYDGAGARARGADGFRLVTVCADASLLAMGGAAELATARG